MNSIRIQINKEELKQLLESGLSPNQISQKLGFSHGTIMRRLKMFGFNRTDFPTMYIKRKHSEETKLRMSIQKKQWLKDNPDKHNWRKKDKFKSVPCEKLKEWLKSKGIEYIEEYQPMVNGRHYSIDIAFPDKLIGIEVNGNQHYNNDGTLKEYYQNRHNDIESGGWKLYELHFSICFNLEKIEKLIPDILNSDKKVEFDYKVYIKPKKDKKIAEGIRREKIKKEKSLRVKTKVVREIWVKCPQCDNLKHHAAKLCKPCFRKTLIRVYTTKEELEGLIFQMPMSEIGKKFGVSDNAIKKWCKKLGVILPSMRGYWAKRHAGMSHEKALNKVAGLSELESEIKH